MAHSWPCPQISLFALYEEIQAQGHLSAYLVHGMQMRDSCIYYANYWEDSM